MADPIAGDLYADTSASSSSSSERRKRRHRGRGLTLGSDRDERHRDERATGRAGVADGRVVLELLAALTIIPTTDDARALAATMEPVELRTLDAIRLAAALGHDLAAELTDDRRMADAARSRDIEIVAPS